MQDRSRLTRPARWIPLLTLAIIGVIASAVAYTAIALPGCTSCHDVMLQSTPAAHADIRCASCHVQDTFVGRTVFATRVVFVMSVPHDSRASRSHAAVPSVRCLACHREDVLVAGAQGSQGLRISHITCMGGSSCTDCHSTIAHGAAIRWPRSPQMERCFDCHGATNKLTACETCHSGGSPEIDAASSTFRVTHGPAWEKTHGMGEMGSCAACHDAEKCRSCHGAGVPHGDEFLKRHAEHSGAADAQCISCHRAEFCSDCHAYEMPHSTSFVIGHSQTVADDGEGGCLTCHTPADCSGCHEEHVHPVTQEQIDGIRLRQDGEVDR